MQRWRGSVDDEHVRITPLQVLDVSSFYIDHNQLLVPSACVRKRVGVSSRSSTSRTYNVTIQLHSQDSGTFHERMR